MKKMITISIKVNASLERAWEYWTQAKHIVNWNFANDEWYCPNAVNDVRVNGQFSWRMEAKDRSMCFDFEGTYTKVEVNKLLEYDLGDGRPVQVKFERQGNTILLTETFEGEDENAMEMQRQGWQAILENYKKYVEGES